MQTAKIILCFLIITITFGIFAGLANPAQQAGADVPAGKLTSLSFAPYRAGFSPLAQFPLPRHIDEDLALLAHISHGIRTYSVLGGMQPTPALAEKYGITMTMGAWLGDGPKDNAQEIAALIAAANAYPHVVKQVIVGNEVMLRKDMTIDALLAQLREVKRAVKQPVSYADVWSIYLKYPQLFKEVDFVTLHILPYWEDEPVAVEAAVAHVENIVKTIAAQAARLGFNKPIVIGETGWPRAGRQRGGAVPGRVNETQFIRGVIQAANRQHIPYNIVEAFDQLWKSHHEGVVGANWGLFSVDRQPVIPLTGWVSEHPEWLWQFALSGAVSASMVLAYRKTLGVLSLPTLLIFLVFSQLLGECLINLMVSQWTTSYSGWQRAYTIVIVLANVGLGGLLLKRLTTVLTNGTDSEPLATRLRHAYLFFAGLAALKAFHLAIDGRYLSFPSGQFAIATLGVGGLLLGLCWQQQRFAWQNLAFDRLAGWRISQARDSGFGYALGLGATALLIGETLTFFNAEDFILAHPHTFARLRFAWANTINNGQLRLWLVCLLVLSMPFLLGQRSHTVKDLI